MKKTISIHIGGLAFQIDDDAYQLLENYLTNLKAHFQSEEGVTEIIQDIESRIAELLSERLTLNQVIITRTDIEQVIAQIGSPEEFSPTDEDNDSWSSQTKVNDEPDNQQTTAEGQYNQPHGTDADSPYTDTTDPNGSQTSTMNEKGKTKVYRKLFRNPDDKMVGGVLSGLAAYTRIDVTVIRLLTIILFFPMGIPILIAYFICCLVIPEAKTAADKLSMRGESVTVENIGKTVIEESTPEEEIKKKDKSNKNRGEETKGCLVSGASLFFKGCLILLAFLFSPFLFAMAITIIALIFAAIVTLIAGGSSLFAFIPFGWDNYCHPIINIIGPLGAILTFGIPLATVVYLIFQSLFKWRPLPSYLKWTLGILWIIGIIICIVAMSQCNWTFPWHHHMHHWYPSQYI